MYFLIYFHVLCWLLDVWHLYIGCLPSYWYFWYGFIYIVFNFELFDAKCELVIGILRQYIHLLLLLLLLLLLVLQATMGFSLLSDYGNIL